MKDKHFLAKTINNNLKVIIKTQAEKNKGKFNLEKSG